MEDLSKVRDAEMEEFEKRKEAAKGRQKQSGSTFQGGRVGPDWNTISM